MRVLVCMFFTGLALVVGVPSLQAEAKVRVDENGTMHFSAFELKESAYFSEDTRNELKLGREIYFKGWATSKDACPPLEKADIADIPAIRTCRARAFYKTAYYKDLTERYDVTIAPKTIAGVYTEVFVPKEGVAGKNKHRILINLHGGSFSYGSRRNSHAESIPIAAVGKIKVISVDYRMGPEHKHPAAVEDVITVYKSLLHDYKPENIGIYGCSAGGGLTAQSIAWFLDQKLPLPGAVGMFCSGASTHWDATKSKIFGSDSLLLWSEYSGSPSMPYFSEADFSSPLVSPGGYDEIMKQFPPSLLISSTRDYMLSGVVFTHAQLTRLGVDADLHVWEGLQHAFLYGSRLKESREAYDVIVNFFDKHLSKR